uniref:Uncharacterized protein n=1 Tax=Arundo donax TaxID=35708 RepID=A0A0A9H115_ARUDO
MPCHCTCQNNKDNPIFLRWLAVRVPFLCFI